MLVMVRYLSGKEFKRVLGDQAKGKLIGMAKACIRIVTDSIILESGRKGKWMDMANYTGIRKKYIIKDNSNQANFMAGVYNIMGIHA